MKQLLKHIFWTCILGALLIPNAFAATVETIAGPIDEEKLRNGNFSIQDIPGFIKGAINFFMGIAGTISIIFIIIGAYFIMFWDIANDKSKGKDVIMKAIWGFAISSLAWIIVRLIVDNFT